MVKLSDGDKYQIAFIVARFHVGTSNRAVVVDFYRRMRGKALFTPPLRKAIYRHALQCHKSNVELYCNVVNGTL